jgi:hypothetical protein
MNKEELLEIVGQLEELLQGDGLSEKQKRSYKLQLNTCKIKLEATSLSDIAQKVGQIDVKDTTELRRLSGELRTDAVSVEKQVAFAEKSFGLLKLLLPV